MDNDAEMEEEAWTADWQEFEEVACSQTNVLTINNQDPTDKDCCWFQLLDDLTILRILELFSFNQRLRLETVCKRWSKLLLLPWERLIKITFKQDDKIRLISPSLTWLYLAGNSPNFHFLLKRAGKNVKNIEIESVGPKNLVEDLQRVAKLCVSLTSLRLRCVRITPREIQALMPLAPKLEELALITCKMRANQKTNKSETVQKQEIKDAFYKFFTHAQSKLKKVKLSSQWLEYKELFFGASELLPLLPQSVRIFHLKLLGLTLEQWRSFLRKNPQMTELDLRVSKDLLAPNESFTPLFELTPKLEALRLHASDAESMDNISDFGRLAKLHNLLKLDVCDFPRFNNDALTAVCHNCSKLISLKIRETGVQKFGLLAVNSIPHLLTLDIRGLREITGAIILEAIRYMRWLKEFCFDANLFDSDEFDSLALFCPQLESVGLGDCTELEPETLHNFIATLMSGSSRAGQPLTLCGGLCADKTLTITHFDYRRTSLNDYLQLICGNSTTGSSAFDSE